MSAPLITRSLAELYLSQGYGVEARDAYASLLVSFPDDGGVKRGLEKAQALVCESKKVRLSVLLAEWVALARLGREGGER